MIQLNFCHFFLCRINLLSILTNLGWRDVLRRPPSRCTFITGASVPLTPLQVDWSSAVACCGVIRRFAAPSVRIVPAKWGHYAGLVAMSCGGWPAGWLASRHGIYDAGLACVVRGANVRLRNISRTLASKCPTMLTRKGSTDMSKKSKDRLRDPAL